MAGASRSILVLAILGATAAPGRADREVRLQLEAGSEYDSNIRRLETGADETDAVQAAPLLRGGTRLDLRWRRTPTQRLTIAGLGVAKLFTERSAQDENVLAVTGDGRYDWMIEPRRAVLSGHAAHVETFHYDVGGPDAGGRNFAATTGEALVTLVGPGSHRVTLSGGLRRFVYKPDADFDWIGDGWGARYRTVIWLGRRELDADPGSVEPGDPEADSAERDALFADGGGEASLELGFAYRLERRRYHGKAFTNACGAGEPPAPTCFMPTRLDRGDLAHVATAELQYLGERIYGGRYELTVNDSNSFGQSLVRQRLTLSATTPLPWRLFATATATVQLNTFLDPLLLARDVEAQTFTALDDENRNAISLHLSRDLASEWTAEARWAFHSNEFATEELRFRRQTLYLGLVWRRRP